MHFQLYNAYVETQDQLLLEKLENKRINKYLDEIVKEVEAKAPILKRQREEYERAQKAVASLSVKLEQAMKVGSIPNLVVGKKKWKIIIRLFFKVTEAEKTKMSCFYSPKVVRTFKKF